MEGTKKIYVRGNAGFTIELLYLWIGAAAWGGTELHFWQAFLWPYYAVTGVIWP